MPYQCDPCQCPEQHYRDSMSWRKAMITLLCNVRTFIEDILDYLSGSIGPSAVAAFSAMQSMTAATLGAAYATVATLPVGTREFILDNQINGDVIVSMDGGTSDTYSLKGGDKLVKNLYSMGLTSTATIQIKDGTQVGTSGSFHVYAIS